MYYIHSGRLAILHTCLTTARAQYVRISVVVAATLALLVTHAHKATYWNEVFWGLSAGNEIYFRRNDVIVFISCQNPLVILIWAVDNAKARVFKRGVHLNFIFLNIYVVFLCSFSSLCGLVTSSFKFIQYSVCYENSIINRELVMWFSRGLILLGF